MWISGLDEWIGGSRGEISGGGGVSGGSARAVNGLDEDGERMLGVLLL
jgi:hypothetical protein